MKLQQDLREFIELLSCHGSEFLVAKQAAHGAPQHPSSAELGEQVEGLTAVIELRPTLRDLPFVSVDLDLFD